MDSNFNMVVRACEKLTEDTDLGNNPLDIKGKDAQEVADALFAMTQAIGALQMLISHLFRSIEIVLREDVPAAAVGGVR